ncbi:MULTISPECIES: hypothetical protein [Corynebacterium]|uniref:hypothetical protein n=1 Tax=Corynebacterium TaxID=1716 RepID=UPI0002DF5CBB
MRLKASRSSGGKHRTITTSQTKGRLALVAVAAGGGDCADGSGHEGDAALSGPLIRAGNGSTPVMLPTARAWAITQS